LACAGRQARLLPPHCRPALGGPELPAAGGGLFAGRTCRYCGQWCGPIAGCWAPYCGLRRVAQPGQLVGIAFPATLVDVRWEAVEAPPMVVLRLLVGTVGHFFFLALATAFLNSLRRAGEGWAKDKALRKANSSCLSMVLRPAPTHFTATVHTEQSVKRHKPRMKTSNNHPDRSSQAKPKF